MADNVKNTINDLIDDLEIKQQKREEGGYDERINTLLDDLYGNATEGFKYDAATDPEHQTAVKDYEREADRSMRDVLGQGAARTGGIASTSAIAAASQARDYQMGQLADVKTKLYQNAMVKNEAETNAKMQILQVLENLEDDERNDYLSLLSMRESIDDGDREEARSQIQNMIALGMAPDADLISASGWGSDYVKAMQKYAVSSMSNLQAQQYMNAMGADLSPDGVWGERSEAWYQQLFDAPSGRQQSSGYTPTPSYTPGYTPTGNNPTANPLKSILSSMGTAQYELLTSEINSALERGDTAKAQELLMNNVDKLSDEQYENLKAKFNI